MFIDKISRGFRYDPAQVIGYSEEELGKIERLYDVKLSGDFRAFLKEMGRCDGGLIGDDPMILYREIMTVRSFVLMQAGTQDEIYDAGFRELAGKNPFIFAIVSESQYYYLRTTSEDPDRVFHYDENEETVRDTNQSFSEFMRDIVAHWGGTSVIARGTSSIASRGELLIV